MKTVLLVDDEKNFLSTLAEGLEEYASHFRTILAGDGQEAIAVLDSTRVDIVVTDLEMPRVDGFTLLAYMSKHRPETPAIVMTAYGSQDVWGKLNAYDVFACLEKPLDFAGFVQTLLNCLEASAEGKIRGIPLPAFLQLVEMERKTCSLTIRSDGRQGRIFFREGELLDAESETARGEAAIYEIVCWDSPEIEIERTCRRTTAVIQNSLQAIMMDAFRIKDERAHDLEVSTEEQDDLTVPAQPEHLTTEDTREVPMTSMKEILDLFVRIDGVTAACLVGRDGFLLESSSRNNIDAEMVAAIAANGFGAAESMGRQLGKGGLNMSMIEYESGPIMLSPAGSEGFVVIVAESNANLGMIRLQLKRQIAELVTSVALV